jgi:hypothetical protein
LSPTPNAKNLDALLGALKAAHTPQPAEPRKPLEVFILSYLIWDGITSRADLALKRIQSHCIDYNEFRVCDIPELITLIGKTYPRAEERAHRLLLGLNEVYRREHEVSLDNCVKLTKREARKYLESIESIPQFVAARTALVAADAHAIPVDERTLEKLLEYNAVPENSSCESAASFIERHVKAADSAQTHAMLQDWSEGNIKVAPPKKSTVPKTKKRPTKKKTTKKTTTKKTTTKKKAR